MRSHTAGEIIEIVSGKLVQGTKDVAIHYGAYRLKQIKNKNTVLFTSVRIIDWKRLIEFFPLVIVTDRKFRLDEVPENVTIIEVMVAEKAYWEFIHYYGALFNIPVVAITGTSGKTTTKEMIRHILSIDYKVTATILSSNSRTAYLQYLLSIDEETEAAVFETAVGAPGDILNAGEYFKPTIGIITNIGAHHLNYCKTLEGYIRAKGEMIDIVDPAGVLIINAEDINTQSLNFNRFSGRIIKVGKDSSCQYRALDITYGKNGMDFVLQHNQTNYQLFVPGFGEHQVYNALAAIAATHEMGLSFLEIAERLKSFRKMNRQLQLIEGINGSTILDDTWSITTTSLEAALKVLKEIGKEKKKIAVIGTITDLGSWGYTIHEQAGEIIHHTGVDILITIGYHAHIIGEQAKKLGMNCPIYSFNNSILVYNLLEKMADSETIILIKGDMYSNSIRELASKIRKKNN